MGTRRLRSSLEVLGRQLGLPPPGDLERVVQAWDAAAGELADRSMPRLLRGGTLVVDVGDAAVGEALRWAAEGVLGRLNADVGRTVASRLDVRVRRMDGRGSVSGGW